MNFSKVLKQLMRSKITLLALLLVIVAVGVFAATRQTTPKNTASSETVAVADTKAKNTTTEAKDTSPQKSTTPDQVVSPPAQTPSTPNIQHPTAADCPANSGLFTVYASNVAGTPAYNDNPTYRDTSGTVLYTVPYKTAITSVYCGADNTVLFHYVGRQIYASFHFEDVSMTQP